MDLFKIFSEIEKVDAEVYERFDTRRRVFKHMAGLGKTVTAATMPAMLTGMFTKAYGQGSATLTADMKAVLNLALQLEYLELYFYSTGLSTPGLIPATDVPAITIIRDDEQGHINALRAVLTTDAIAPPVLADFDYTAGGRLPNPFGTATAFYGTAQSFVDTGVRAYKGGAPRLMANKDVLEAALNIHSVEARHSSHIRLVRRVLAGADTGGEIAGGAGNLKPKSWVSLMENGGPVPAVTAPVYGSGTTTDFPNESNVTQATVNVQTNTAAANFPVPAGVTLTDAQKAAAASEAFDEPLDDAKVKEIARNFRSITGVAKGLFA